MKIFFRILFLFFSIVLLTNFNLLSQVRTEGDPLPSINPPNNDVEVLGKVSNNGSFPSLSKSSLQKVDKSFEGFWFQDNPEENYGFRFIPPDPIGAAGNNLLIAVVNDMIETRNKGGALIWRKGLRDFFAPLFSAPFAGPNELPFDPKIVYDEYRNRFVVAALHQETGSSPVDPNNISRILLAVSKNANPKNAGDWYFQAIDSKSHYLHSPSYETWADYPGLEVDEEAVYLTANTYTFVPFGYYGGSRLWIADKSFYDGGTFTVNKYDPFASTGLATTTMPAQIYGADGAGPGIGTYLVQAGWTDGFGPGNDEYVQVIRVDDPLGTPSFAPQFVDIGDIDNMAANIPLPDAPQLGSTNGIEVNDRRALDAVWRDGYLWMTTTINPNSGDNAGQTTAYWVKLNTSDPDAITLADQGEIKGDDIAPGTFTFFSSVAVNRDGAAMFGFSASAPTIFAGAYVTGRTINDPAGTVRASEIVHEGEAPYFRTFGGTRNRWGDYSGISIDPTNDDFAWAFNEYAAEQGSPTAGPSGPEDGRWGTAWARCKFGGIAKPISVVNSVPNIFKLNQNYPNPFNPITNIQFDLPSTSEVTLTIYNSLGQLVKTLASGNLEAGSHSYIWDGSDQSGNKVSSGIYLYKLTSRNFVKSKKMILMK